MENSLPILKQLVGFWRGQGDGRFPTLDDFRWVEWMRFEGDSERSLIHYEQRASLVDADGGHLKNSHWESGFISVEEDGSLRLLNAQTNRVEILTGSLSQEDGAFLLEWRTQDQAGDARMVCAVRQWRWSGDRFEYRMQMHTTDVRDGSPHLHAVLKRVAENG